MNANVASLRKVEGLSLELSETDRATLYTCQPVLNAILDKMALRKRQEAVRAVCAMDEALDADLAIQNWLWQAVIDQVRAELNVMAKLPASATR